LAFYKTNIYGVPRIFMECHVSQPTKRVDMSVDIIKQEPLWHKHDCNLQKGMKAQSTNKKKLL